ALFFVGGVEPATGGEAISSSTAGGAYATLTGPVYYEVATADAGTGTIILNAPSGFVFDTGGASPTVRIDRLAGGGSNSRNVNGLASGTSAAIASRSTTQITFTVSIASNGGVTCSLTWQNIRVRPLASSPLANGKITKTGSSPMTAVTPLRAAARRPAGCVARSLHTAAGMFDARALPAGLGASSKMYTLFPDGP